MPSKREVLQASDEGVDVEDYESLHVLRHPVALQPERWVFVRVGLLDGGADLRLARVDVGSSQGRFASLPESPIGWRTQRRGCARGGATAAAQPVSRLRILPVRGGRIAGQ
eukprot:4793977-Pleurochrysis_carterae.AAC.1